MTIAEANALSRDQFTAALGWIFEHSPWVAERAWARRPFASLQSLHHAMAGEVERAAREEQLALLRAHPDLGTRAKVSAASQGEQRGAGLDSLEAGEFELLQILNQEYRRKFGFPFIYAVRGSTKYDIQAALQRRLQREPEDELHQALCEVNRIAWFRLQDTFEEV